MKLSFYGAAHEVTGSCYFIEINGKKLLVDCGMEQGADIYENQVLPVSPAVIDAVLVTHAHIDHSGMLPMLYAKGYRGLIFMTQPSRELCEIMLYDSAHIQETEAEWRNRKAKRAAQKTYKPLYTAKDVQGTVKQIFACPYGMCFTVCEGVTARFIDAGHLLGSAGIELTLTENGETRVLCFSGDIGNVNKPIIKNPTPFSRADYVVMESTYGDRSHGEEPDYVGELAKILQKVFDRGGNVVVPTFAVGRMQEMLFFLREIKEKGLVKGHDAFPVYVDSPLAVKATRIFDKTNIDCFDEATRAMIESGINPISFPDLKFSVTTDDSRGINFDDVPKVILSASGMCEAGRIKHHLKHNLWRKASAVVFVGYQVEGTLGRILLNGAKTVTLFNEKIAVRAEIYQLNGTSSHADDNALIDWIKHVEPQPKRVFVTHGNDAVCDSFTNRLISEVGLTATAPYNGETWDLCSDKKLCDGVSTRRVSREPEAGEKRKDSPSFARLVASGNLLKKVIERNEGVNNRDLNSFAKAIEALIAKYNR